VLNLPWDPAALPVVVLLVGATIVYSLMHYLFAQPRLQARFEAKGIDAINAQELAVVFRRIRGGSLLLFGMLGVELLAGRPLFETLAAVPGPTTVAWVGGSLAVLAPILWLSGRGAQVQAAQPESRNPVQSPTRILGGWAAWALYLLGYEYLFRGALLFGLAATLGAWPALAITTAIYALVHLPKPMLGETLGSIAMGFVFGAMALDTGTIWAPWLVHMGIVVVTEVSAGRHNPAIAWWTTGDSPRE